MSARGHVDVNERRLRPIYDCLDNGNNKKAIQEADKVLRKQKDFQCAKVLKALALLRMGRTQESTAMLHDVHVQHPTDDSTLQAMAICYREMQKLDLIADMYENAHKLRPDNEEILSALFMAYVRLSNYKKQQQTAIALHKLRPKKNPYYFWAVMSIVMQAHENEKLAQTMYLPLAERMTMKYVNEGRVEADAEVQMYLIILELMGRYEEALKVVRGPLGGKLSSDPQFQQLKAAELMLKLEQWPKVNGASRKLLLEDNDHWQCYLDYFKSLFALIEQGWTPEQDNSIDDPVDHTIDQALSFVKSQVDKCEEMSHTPRGPFLARLELLKQLQQQSSKDTEKLPPPTELLKDFFRRFGDKLCCFTDLQMFLELVEQDDRLQLIEDLFGELNLRHEDGTLAFPQDVKLLQRQLCLLQLAHYLGLHHSLSYDEQLQLASQLLNVYTHGLTFGESLLETDLQHSDNFLLLAAHILVNLHHCTGSNKYLWQAVSQLERGSKKSPSNFQFKVLLIQLYATLGAFGPCATIYEHMEIKHVQNDALGYVISNHVSRLGHFSSASSIYNSMLKFFSGNYKDISECLIASYKYGSFSKIHEFVKFRERLENSIQHIGAQIEKQMVELIITADSPQVTESVLENMEVEAEVDHIQWNNLKDNRDFSILVTWSPPEHALTELLKQKSFSEEVAWLRIRSLVMRLLAAASKISPISKGSTQCRDCHNGAHNANTADMPSLLADLTKQLRTHLSECQTSPVHTQYPICGPFRTRLGTFLKLKLGDVLLEMLDITLYIHSYTENPTDNQDEKFESRMESGLVNTIAELVKHHTRPLVEGQLHQYSDEGEIHRRELEPDVIENLVLISEVLSHITVLAGVCHHLVKHMRSAHTKRQKKKKGAGAPLPATISKVDTLISGIMESVKTLHDVVHSIDTDILSSELGELKLFDEELALPQREDKMEKEVTDKVRRSYQKSAAELSQLLALKIKYLSSLRS